MDNIRDARKEALARELLSLVYPDRYSERWSIEISEDGIGFCEGYYYNGQPHDWEVFGFEDLSGSVWEHLKRGTMYNLMAIGHLQVEPERKLKDGDPLYVYADKALGKVWLRPPDEFKDGRFERMDMTHHPVDLLPCKKCGSPASE